jgi:chemotaxis protein MotA
MFLVIRPEVSMVWIQRLLIGMVGLAIVFVLRDTLLSFFDLPSLFITLGGTLAATCFSYPWETLRGLGSIIRTVLTTTADSRETHARKLMQLAQLNYTGGLRALESHEAELHDPLLQRAVNMIVDMRHEDDVRAVVEHEFFLLANRYEAAHQVLLTIGKLLPSFGMVGTLIGLVLLLRQATDPDPQALAPALAIAVLTTLYGAVFANALVLPLAAKLQVFIQNQELLMRLTVEGAMLIARNQPLTVVQKRLTLLATHGEFLGSEPHTSLKEQPQLALLHR